MTHLQALYDDIRDGKGPRVHVIMALDTVDHVKMCVDAYNGNTQAAIDFVQAVLPGHEWMVSNDCEEGSYSAGVYKKGFKGGSAEGLDTPACALLLAALAAMIAKGEG